MDCCCEKKPNIPISLCKYDGPQDLELANKIAASKKSKSNSYRCFTKEQIHLLIYDGEVYIIQTNKDDIVKYFGL